MKLWFVCCSERARVQNDGEVRADMTIPDWADPGEDFVFVIVTEDNRDYASRRVDIVDTKVTGGSRNPRAPWTEVWTIWACGKLVRQTWEFTPGAGGTSYRLR